MPRFIVRVDDVGQDLDQSKPDVGLSYFREWWDAWGDTKDPVYLGIVPAVLGEYETEILQTFERTTGAVLCLHGWDHKKQVLSKLDISNGCLRWPMIHHFTPPYNMYDTETIAAIEAMAPPCPVLFGGIWLADHDYGPQATMIGRVLHLPADPDFYAHAYRLIDRVAEEERAYPIVVTLHHRWDSRFLDGVSELHKVLAGMIVSTDEAWPSK